MSANSGIAQTDPDFIPWGTKALEWTDFKGKPELNSKYKANTHSTLRTPISWDSDTVSIEVIAEFVKSKSWVIDNNQSMELLKHEQIHFDITEYHARLFRQELLNYTFSSFETIGEEISTLFNLRFKKSNEMQILYDTETNHSRNNEEQTKWNKKMHDLLIETELFNKQKLKIFVGYLE